MSRRRSAPRTGNHEAGGSIPRCSTSGNNSNGEHSRLTRRTGLSDQVDRPFELGEPRLCPTGSPNANPRAIIFLVTQATARAPVLVRARFFDGLADPARLALLEALREGERTAGEVALAAALSPSNASKHLACLRDCGLVESRQDWRYVYYWLAPGVGELLDVNDVFIERVADRIAACQRPEMRSR
jgi:DNA-binding transcriptional ArsR family regulator